MTNDEKIDDEMIEYYLDDEEDLFIDDVENSENYCDDIIDEEDYE